MLCRSHGYRARGTRCQFVGKRARCDIEPEPNINELPRYDPDPWLQRVQDARAGPLQAMIKPCVARRIAARRPSCSNITAAFAGSHRKWPVPHTTSPHASSPSSARRDDRPRADEAQHLQLAVAEPLDRDTTYSNPPAAES